MYYPDVPALEPEELELLCHEYVEHNATLDPHLADQMGVKRGLRNLDGTGVLAGITNVSNVVGYDKKEDGTIVPIPGRLIYRGIDLDALAAEADASDRFMAAAVRLSAHTGPVCQVPQTAGEPPRTAPRLCRRYDLELAFAQPDEQDGAKRAGHVQLR